MCGQFGNTSGQRIQINFDLKKSRIKLIKLNQGLKLIDTTPRDRNRNEIEEKQQIDKFDQIEQKIKFLM